MSKERRWLQNHGEREREHTVTRAAGILKRIRLVPLKSGQMTSRLCYGRIDRLTWDPDRLQWPDQVPCMQYSAKLGRSLLRERHPIQDTVTQIWGGMSPANFNLKRANTWNKERVRKKEGLLWFTWHPAVAENAWRGRIDGNIDQCCRVCLRDARETVLHMFWECLSAAKAWNWGIYILQLLANTDLSDR